MQSKFKNEHAFDFGTNWKEYSKAALNDRAFIEARNSLKNLLGERVFAEAEVLDVGCGSGIFSLAAAQLGAKSVIGLDINPNSIAASEANAQRWIEAKIYVRFVQADILSPEPIRSYGQFDILYAWGSLHHTGQMNQAIRNCAEFIRPGGYFALAIYNRHLTSEAWKAIKRTYNKLPFLGKKVMVGIFYPIIWAAKWIVTGKNPLRMHRGMNFYHDVVDWVGGYPYEYATGDEMIKFVSGLGFKLVKFVPCQLPTGNNQFVFMKE